MALTKLDRRIRIKRRIRKVVSGTAERPRMSVFRSNKEIYAQLIDDISGKTLMSASSRDKSIASKKGTKVEIAKMVGASIAEKAKSEGIDTVSFDRNGYLYHGRVKSMADGAREAGLNF